MNEHDILQRIIDEGGSCNWVEKIDDPVCSKCPLSRLQLRGDGKTYHSCVDAVGTTGLTEAETDQKYKKVAEQLLMDMSFEKDILEE